MIQTIKNSVRKLSNFIAKKRAEYRLSDMSVEYRMTGNYIDDLGVSHYDGRGIDAAYGRFRERFFAKAE